MIKVFLGQRTRRKRPAAVGAAVGCEGEDLVLDDTVRGGLWEPRGGEGRCWSGHAAGPDSQTVCFYGAETMSGWIQLRPGGAFGLWELGGQSLKEPSGLFPGLVPAPPAQDLHLEHFPCKPRALGQAWQAHYRGSANLREPAPWGRDGALQTKRPCKHLEMWHRRVRQPVPTPPGMRPSPGRDPNT